MTERPGGRSPASVHLPFGLVVLICVIGFVRIATQNWREGAVLIGGALLVAAAMRVFIASEQLGLLAIRSRTVDIMLYSGLGLLIVSVALTITQASIGA